MKKLLLILLVAFSSCTNVQKEASEEITTYYLIRHAEKDRSDPTNEDPELNAEGMERANKWAEVFDAVKFDAIYSTPYKRTMQTAMPTANSKKLKNLGYDPNKLFDQDFEAGTKGKTILVVGHSNTTPMFVNAILGDSVYENIDDSQNGALFIVEILPDGKKTHKVLYIN
ncbi:phosphoglycerate mutase family protein [Gramella sp. AN32]|uniref:Phosphoglycerate mutase family protein n=1 Tax=Christiangramia antarctica TaxID=2058158 RepID=A0ABW5X8W3_9FLAO|nr:phosphoglycerate mutase family protein [Gramella sp. AN32]MCM4154547.1 phosphoglycerate mutase [Gramella sp. AN32]